MLRKIMIAAAATAFVGAMVAAGTADARMGGGGGGFRGGGGFHGGGFGGGGFRGGFAGGGFRGARFGGVRMAGVAPGFGRGAFARGTFGHGRFVGPGFRHGFNHRFHNRRFFAAAPFFVGAGFYPYYDDYAYGGSCYAQQWTAYGWRYVYVCGDY